MDPTKPSWNIFNDEEKFYFHFLCFQMLLIRLQARSQLQRIGWLKESAAPPNFTCCREPARAGGEKLEAAHLLEKASVLHRGTLLNIIQMRKNIFPAYLKKSGRRSSHYWGRLSSLFCWGYCGGLHVGIGGVMRGLRPPDGGAFAVQRPLDTGWMNGGLDVIVMHRDNSPFIQPQMWRPLSPAHPEMRRKGDCNSLHNPDPSFCSGGEKKKDIGAIFVNARSNTRGVKACAATKWRRRSRRRATAHSWRGYRQLWE